MDTITMSELEARRSLLLKQLGRIGPLIDGSLATVYRRCGTPTCRCHQADEHRHRQVMLCTKVGGRTHSTHIPKALEEQVREWNEEHKRVRKLLKEISGIDEQIIRLHVRSGKAATRRPVLRLVEPGPAPEGKPQP